MKLDRYEVAALRERLRSARKELDLIDTLMRSRSQRLEALRAEVETINDRIEAILQHAGIELTGG